MSKIIIAVSFAAAGVIAGWALHSPRGEPPVASVRGEEAPAPLAPVIERAELGALIRAIVHDELERASPRAAAAPVASTAKQAPDDTPASAEQVAARDSGQSLIEGARRAGRWTEDDRQRFGEVMVGVDAAGREELFQLLIPAFNRQEIKLETHGAPF